MTVFASIFYKKQRRIFQWRRAQRRLGNSVHQWCMEAAIPSPGEDIGGSTMPSPGGKVAERERGRMRNAGGNITISQLFGHLPKLQHFAVPHPSRLGP